ncbi:ubiquitin carboxyl-terminal hydrolase 15-like isoform X1 [Mytilus galloprovincialis]|uniref:ubiquitin carboxyl-terminal hydrolase 15-like isoform X1 n=1 Tax=Mytilus galloprovincialis TaxID=29158 RepID=UPI003F7C8EC1
MAEGGVTDSSAQSAISNANALLENQKSELKELLKKPLKRDDKWFLLDTKWFKQWKKYVGYESWDAFNVGQSEANPGPVDNSPLVEEGKLKEHLIDELDYQLVPEEAWGKIMSWYGMIEGQTPVERKVIEQGMFVKHCKVEVYMLDVKMCENSNLEKIINKSMSRADTIEDLEKEMRKTFEIAEDKEVRLWYKYMSNTYEHLSKKESTLQDAALYSGQVIVIEQKNEDGTWPRQAKNTNSYNSGSYTSTRSSSSGYDSGYGGSSYGYYGYDQGRGGSVAPGLCGLSNLGNTCFMNSAIQCMSNVPKLTEYLLSDRWISEVNESNPLGMGGEIAKSYAELIKVMWSGKYSHTVPRNFKVAVGRFAPQFSGYQQQDSQELLAFLLDGLHEDLNRIHKKPYIEQKDTDDRPDELVAKESWENYRKRNDSVIVDTFHGLLKSTVHCPECDKISVTFDPFCYLSLPLPVKKERQLEIFWVPLSPEKKPVQFKLIVPKMGSVLDMCKILSEKVGVEHSKMAVTDVYNHRFHKVFNPEESLSYILDRDDIFIYEVPVSTNDDPDTVIVPIYMREKKSRNSYHSGSFQLFGQPLLLPVSKKNCTYESFYNTLLHRISRYVKMPAEDDKWWLVEKDGKMTNGTSEDEKDSDEDKKDDDTQMDTSSDTKENLTNGDINGEVNGHDKTEKTSPLMCKFTLVNSYGSTELGCKMAQDGQPLKLSHRTYVAVDWNPLAQEKFYDDKAAEDFEQDDSINHKPQKKQVIQLGDCLDLFTKEEQLGENDLWYCPRCKKHQQATKKFDLWSLPDVLIIHLKRFSYNRYFRDKIDVMVECPPRGLNMNKYMINNNHGAAKYDLIAVSNHYGGLGGGHYTAYGKNKENSEWYYFDDSSVSSSSEDDAVSKAAYVVVYQKQTQCQPNSKSSTTTMNGQCEQMET